MHTELAPTTGKRLANSSRNGVLLRARVVLPSPTERISDGAVYVRGDQCEAVGAWRDLRDLPAAEQCDLGEVILLTGLINAHCHLDYTDMAGQLPPQRSFPDWIKLIKETKEGWTTADYRRSWLRGARMLLNTGTTTVADVEAVPQLLPKAWRTTPLKVTSFLEMIGLGPEPNCREILQRTSALAGVLDAKSPSRIGLSPHAPYSTTRALLRGTSELARERDWRVMIHVAESEPEYVMFWKGRGELHSWLAKSGRAMDDCGGRTPVRHVLECGLSSDSVILVHANYLRAEDVEQITDNNLHVVHCPRSHHYFQHRRFPLRRLMRAGANVALGTDSLASVYRSRGQKLGLDMFAEMRTLQKAHPWLGSRRMLEMATVNGARALGLAETHGQLRAGYRADMICIKYDGSVRGAVDYVPQHEGSVHGSMIDGRWALRPKHMRTLRQP